MTEFLIAVITFGGVYFGLMALTTKLDERLHVWYCFAAALAAALITVLA